MNRIVMDCVHVTTGTGEPAIGSDPGPPTWGRSRLVRDGERYGSPYVVMPRVWTDAWGHAAVASGRLREEDLDTAGHLTQAASAWVDLCGRPEAVAYRDRPGIPQRTPLGPDYLAAHDACSAARGDLEVLLWVEYGIAGSDVAILLDSLPSGE